MLVGAANALAAERRSGMVCYDNMKKRIAMEMGFEFRFIRLNEANVREHLLRN